MPQESLGIVPRKYCLLRSRADVSASPIFSILSSRPEAPFFCNRSSNSLRQLIGRPIHSRCVAGRLQRCSDQCDAEAGTLLPWHGSIPVLSGKERNYSYNQHHLED